MKYRLFDAFGIPVYLDVSLIILLAMFVLGGGSFWAGIACASMLLASITAHEFGHALTARAFGYPTRDITLSLIGGCASLIALPRKASQEFLTAIAGPAVSFALAVLGAGGIALAADAGGFLDAAGLVAAESLGAFGLDVSLGEGVMVGRNSLFAVECLLYFSTMNMMLFFFNMLPGFPMDGGRVFRSAMLRFTTRLRATYVAMVVGRAVAVLIGLRGLWRFTHGGSWGLVTVLIAWMIWREGYREYLLARMEDPFGGEPFGGYRARVSPPPYGGRGEDCDVGKC
jgi:stage IV sporulation protein FB